MKKLLKILRHNVLIVFIAACLFVFGAASQLGDPRTWHGTITPMPIPTPKPTSTPSPIPISDFDVAKLLKQFDTTVVQTTANLPGDDVGAKINQADAKCGNRYCIIVVVGNDPFKTAAYTSENRFIKYLGGTHKSLVKTGYGRVHYPKNNTLIYSDSWNSIIEEANDDLTNPSEPPRHSLIAPFNATIVPYNRGESTANILKSSNIHVIGLHFRGSKVNRANDIGLSTVGIGNDDNSSVQDCFFEAVSGYGVAVGATPGEKVVGATLPDGRTVGYHARNCAVLRNRFENLLTQNIGIITVNGLILADNQFINPGKLQPNGSFSPFLTVIDVEPNGSDREIIVGVRIVRNLIDARASGGSQYFGAIAFQITNPEIFNEKNEISGNVILGVETGKGQLSFGISVTSPGTNDLLIERNTIKNAGQSGLQLTGNNIRAIDNTLENVGGGGNAGMSAFSLRNSQIKKTRITLSAGGIPGSNDIWESRTNENNVWEENTADVISHRAGSVVTKSVYRNNVLKYGVGQTANSKDNIFEGNK